MSGTRAISSTSGRELSSSSFFLQGKAPKELHAIQTKTLVRFLPGRAKELSAPRYCWKYSVDRGPHATCEPHVGCPAVVYALRNQCWRSGPLGRHDKQLCSIPTAKIGHGRPL